MKILSFHPLFEGDQNILCAGRDPDRTDLEALKTADAVILPQGCQRALYEMATRNCRHVFPNYRARFDYPEKIGQIQLFQETGMAHPQTETFSAMAAFAERYGELPGKAAFEFPFVFKFNWGGEGDNVFRVANAEQFQNLQLQAIRYERTGQTGFLLQEFIPTRSRALRVVVIGRTILAYWRIHPDPNAFYVNIPEGAVIDAEADPNLQAAAVMATRFFCQKTGINLAGFDFLFSSQALESGLVKPLFLEINYFFGRRGLGGSEKFYELLQEEIKKWIDALPL
jgi:ribosomal protein S6--L-glutamate ligase